MTMTDPVADLLTRLRNANSAYHETVSLPNSKLKTHIAEILETDGFIAGWKIEDARVGQTLTIDLKYGPNRERSIAGIKRVSKPGLRVYAKSTNLPRVLGGLGVVLQGADEASAEFEVVCQRCTGPRLDAERRPLGVCVAEEFLRPLVDAMDHSCTQHA